jgi:hypothetical protein
LYVGSLNAQRAKVTNCDIIVPQGITISCL